MNFSELPAKERATFINEAAAQRGVSHVVVEKDAWVSWVLRALFEEPDLEADLQFKGGTSLSKVYGLIDRFSEDIDLGIRPERLGVDEEELAKAPSKNKRQELHRRLNEKCTSHLAREVHPRLEAAAARSLGACPFGSWFRPADEQVSDGVLLFEYPRSLANSGGYLIPIVKLEFGSLTDQQPFEMRQISTLLSEILGQEFDDLSCEVRTIHVVRTFWEKATILHDCALRPLEKPLPPRYVRHYSDFARMWTKRGPELAANRKVLEDVAKHKTHYFASSWSSYERIPDEGVRLTPPRERLNELRSDYQSMKPMFLSEPVSFEVMCGTLAEAEKAINAGSA